MPNPYEAPQSPSSLASGSPSTRVRFLVVAVATLSAVLLYLDRVCLGQAEASIKEELSLSDTDVSWLLSAFFWSYALFQVPAGWISDRFGARKLMTIYIVAWSGFTALFGLANSLPMLIGLRMCVGIAQAGAYPTSGALLRRWIEFPLRGTASAIVSWGGRLGGVIAPVATGALIVAFGNEWRPVVVIYGLLGVGVGVLFFVVFRERPEEHPWCNDAERELVAQHQPPQPSGNAARTEHFGVILARLATQPSMWLMCLCQMTTNIGWAFLITWLARYLKANFKLPEEESGMWVSIVLLVGSFGMLAGGPLTDRLTRRLGVRWGRSLPIVLTRALAAAGFLVCFAVDDLYVQIAALALVAIATDMGTPSMWAFMQDVGGRYVGGVLGWGNMWGNFGAALSPILVYWAAGDPKASGFIWSNVFVLGAASFAVSGLAALGIDATCRLSRHE